MLKLFRRYYFHLSIGVAVVTFLLMFFSHSRRDYDYIFADLFQAVTSPIVAAADSFVAFTQEQYQNYINLSSARAENASLKQEVSRLKSEILSYQARVADLPKLEKAFQFLDQTTSPLKSSMLYALVTAAWQSDFSQVILINRGRKDGVEKDQGVVSYSGIVGKVIKVNEDSAVVAMITDLRSKVPVILAKTRTRAILEGDGKGGLFLRMLRREEAIAKDDVVVTSGVTSIFPSGYQVGTVEDVYKKEFGWFQEAVVRPAVDLAKIEDVFVLKGTGKKGGLENFE